MAVWLVTAVGFGTLLALAQASGSTLDDPDPARQRPGFLDAGALPQPAPRLAPALIRHRTLDPTVADHLGEVRTMLRAVE